MVSFQIVKLHVNSLDQFLFRVKKLLSDGGGVEERYMSETITHAIADDCEADDYSEAKELFELTVVTVRYRWSKEWGLCDLFSVFVQRYSSKVRRKR